MLFERDNRLVEQTGKRSIENWQPLNRLGEVRYSRAATAAAQQQQPAAAATTTTTAAAAAAAACGRAERRLGGLALHAGTGNF
jgi:hypothetical protein